MRKEADPLLSDVRVKHLIAQSVPHYHIQCRVCWTLANLLSLTWYHSSRCIIHYHNYIATCAIHTATATPANFRHFFFFLLPDYLRTFFFTHSLAAAADVSAKSSDISPRSNSSMSRRKQAKPQHLKSDEEDPALGGVLSENGECCFSSTTNKLTLLGGAMWNELKARFGFLLSSGAGERKVWPRVRHLGWVEHLGLSGINSPVFRVWTLRWQCVVTCMGVFC